MENLENDLYSHPKYAIHKFSQQFISKKTEN